MSKISKIIFDNDGVNMDSEQLAMQVMDDFGYDMVARYHAEPIEGLARGDIYRTYAGTSSDQIIRQLIEKYNLPFDALKEDYNLGDIADNDVYEALSNQLTEQTLDRFSGELKAIPGIEEALVKIDEMLGGIENRALCTTSREDRMNLSLACAINPSTGELAGLDRLFPDEDNRRVSGYGHPNKYTLFMELNPDWNPAETGIVEDTVSGVTKALSADPALRVIGTVASEFYGSTYIEKKTQVEALIDAGASIVVFDVADLPAALEWLEKGASAENLPDFIGSVRFRTQNDQPREELNL